MNWSACCSAHDGRLCGARHNRHECGSRYADRGLDGRHIQMLLGYSDLKTTERYLNSDTKRLAEAMKRAGGHSQRPVPNRSHWIISPDRRSRKTPNFIGGTPGDRTRDTVIKKSGEMVGI